MNWSVAAIRSCAAFSGPCRRISPGRSGIRPPGAMHWARSKISAGCESLVSIDEPAGTRTQALALKRLEPISKLLEEHGDARKPDKAQEIGRIVFPANEEPSLPLQP